MNVEDVRSYCLSKPHTWEDFPFDEKTLVLKVDTKMFALVGLERFPLSINLKCDPEYAEELRSEYEAIQPGYHMSKKHWNTVSFDKGLKEEFLKELIQHSYDLVYDGLTKKMKQELKGE